MCLRVSAASEVHVKIEVTGPFAFLLANAVQMLSVVDWNGVWMHFYIDSLSLMMVPHESFLFKPFRPTGGGKYCLGERKRYRSCNTDVSFFFFVSNLNTFGLCLRFFFLEHLSF